MKKLLIILILTHVFITAQTQSFNKGNLSIISTAQIIPENYFVINLEPEKIDDPKANQFDVNNNDTRLQVLLDNNQKKYHILLQINFIGRITFLSISSNLSTVFNRKDKPAFVFENCMQDLNTYISPGQNIETALSCVIQRLEYCSK